MSKNPSGLTPAEAEAQDLRHKGSSRTTLADTTRSPADTETGPLEASKVSLWTYMNSDVDPLESTGPLSAYCFMTGYMYVAPKEWQYIIDQSLFLS